MDNILIWGWEEGTGQWHHVAFGSIILKLSPTVAQYGVQMENKKPGYPMVETISHFHDVDCGMG